MPIVILLKFYILNLLFNYLIYWIFFLLGTGITYGTSFRFPLTSESTLDFDVGSQQKCLIMLQCFSFQLFFLTAVFIGSSRNTPPH